MHVDEARAIVGNMIEDLMSLHRKLLIMDELLRDGQVQDAKLSRLRSPHDSVPDGSRGDGDPGHLRPTHDRRETLAREDPPGGPPAFGGPASVTDIRRPRDDRARGDLPPAAQHLSAANGGGKGARVRIVEGRYTGEVGLLLDFHKQGFGRVYAVLKGPNGTFRALARNVELDRG